MIFDTLYIQIIFRKHVIGNSKINTDISKEFTIHYTKKELDRESDANAQ